MLLVSTKDYQLRLIVSLIFGGLLPPGVGAGSSSPPDTIGELKAKGEGTAGNPYDGPRLKARFGRLGVAPGVAMDPEGVEGIGGVPVAEGLLNSAHRGHFRFVSTRHY